MTATLTPGRNGARVGSEPLTYRLGSGPSYFADLLRSQPEHGNATTAQERLRRHEREMRTELKARPLERRGNRALEPEGTTYETRAPSGAPGSGGYATPPLWAIELTATAPRPMRLVSDLIGSLPLADGVSSVNVPLLTTGTSTGPQTPNAPVSDSDVADAASSSPVVNVAGQEDVPLGMLEQSPAGAAHLDQVLFRDLTSDYDARLEFQLINGPGGTGPFGQILGLLNVPGVNPISYNATPSGTTLYPYFGQAFGAVSDTRRIRPEGWLMRGGRFAWLATSEDGSSRPLEVPLAAQHIVTDPTLPNPVAGLVGLPVFTAEAIPTNLGVGVNQDAIVAWRWSDALLWESEPRLNVFTEVVSGTLMARLQYRAYAAAILGRYPSSVAVIGGTGLAVQASE